MKETKKLLDLGSNSIFLDRDEYGSLSLRIGINHPGVTRLAPLDFRELRQLAIAMLQEAERLDDEREEQEMNEAMEKLSTMMGVSTR